MVDPKQILAAQFSLLGIRERAVAKQRKTHKIKLPRHLVIPDTQCKPGVPDVHLEWIGQYIVDEFAGEDLTIIHLGDHWDMPSLSSYDRKGGTRLEGQRIVLDIAAGNEAFDKLCWALERVPKWKPRKVFLFGNHEDRISRVVAMDAQLEGLLSLDQLDTHDWERHAYLEVVDIHGVDYSHYFANPMTGRPYGGQSIDTRLKSVGRSFTMGHQQGLKYGMREVGARSHHGLVAGSCYLHDEEYRGPQGNVGHWRGIAVCSEVEDGSYSFMDVTLDYLCRRFEAMRLSEFRERYAA